MLDIGHGRSEVSTSVAGCNELEFKEGVLAGHDLRSHGLSPRGATFRMILKGVSWGLFLV